MSLADVKNRLLEVVDREGLHSASRGDYRVIYRIDENRRRVDAVAIEHRSEIYRPRQL